MTQSNWVLTVPLSKAEDDNGRWIIQGLISGPGIDAQGDNVTEPAVDRLVERINERPVPLRNFHKLDGEPTIILDMGETISAFKTEDGDAAVQIELDQDNPEAQYLWKKLDKGKQYGLSIHGPAEATFHWDNVTQSRVMDIHDVDVAHIGVTTRPAFTKSFGTVVRKSLEEADVKESNLSDTITEDKTTVEKSDEATSAPEVTAQPESEVVVEKSQQITRDELSEMFNEFAKNLVSRLGALPATEETDTPASVEETVPATAEKSMPAEEQSDDAEWVAVVKSLEAKITGLQSELETLRSEIPDTQIPGALVSKSKSDELAELYASMNASDRIRYGLALAHGEDK